jgi:hypothetical protein
VSLEGLPRFHAPWSGFLAFAAQTPLRAEVHRGLSSVERSAHEEFSAFLTSIAAIKFLFLSWPKFVASELLEVKLLTSQLYSVQYVARHFFAGQAGSGCRCNLGQKKTEKINKN